MLSEFEPLNYATLINPNWLVFKLSVNICHHMNLATVHK